MVYKKKVALKETKIFNGKRYDLNCTRLYRMRADAKAESLRSKGFTVRIHEGWTTGSRPYPAYGIYTRKK